MTTSASSHRCARSAPQGVGCCRVWNSDPHCGSAQGSRCASFLAQRRIVQAAFLAACGFEWARHWSSLLRPESLCRPPSHHILARLLMLAGLVLAPQALTQLLRQPDSTFTSRSAPCLMPPSHPLPLPFLPPNQLTGALFSYTPAAPYLTSPLNPTSPCPSCPQTNHLGPYTRMCLLHFTLQIPLSHPLPLPLLPSDQPPGPLHPHTPFGEETGGFKGADCDRSLDPAPYDTHQGRHGEI